MPPLKEKGSSRKPAKKSANKAANKAAEAHMVASVQTTVGKAPKSPKELETEVMRHKQKRYVDRGMKTAGDAAKGTAKAGAQKVAGKVVKGAGPTGAALAASRSVKGSQKKFAEKRVVPDFEKKNPGYALVKTKKGSKVVKKAGPGGATTRGASKRYGRVEG